MGWYFATSSSKATPVSGRTILTKEMSDSRTSMPQMEHRVQTKKRLQNAQPQNEILRSMGAWGRCPQQVVCGKWIATSIACYNMFDPKNSVALMMLFSGSNLSYNEEVIGLTGHCLS